MTDSTIDRDGPLGVPSSAGPGFSRRTDLALDPDLPTTEAVAAHLAPREPVPPLDALTIRQWLWGRGFYVPGHAAHVKELVRPLALAPGMTLLDAAAGLGGPARAIAEEFGVTVNALERDSGLARHGMSMSAAAGMQRRAPVRELDPESIELRSGAFDGVLAREATYMVRDKERFLRVLGLALKAEGGLLMTDFVAAAEAPALGAWAALQPHRPMLWSLRQYGDCLRNLGLELSAPEDMSEAYKRQILGGWNNLLRTVDIRSLPRAHRAAIVDELERWARTVAALDAGALRMYRFHALAGRGSRR